jgi:hypothetical protein
MKLRLGWLTIAAFANAAYASSIGLIGDADFTTCNLNIPAPPSIGTLYIVAVDCADIPGACPGFSGAEFRVEGLPPGWLAFSKE